MARWVAALALTAACPGSRPVRDRTVVTATGDVPFPTGFEPGAPLPAPPAADPKAFGAAYLDQLHTRIRDGWHQFLEDCRLRLPPDHVLNSPTLEAAVGLTIDGHGQLVDSTLLRSSGNADFDEVAMSVSGDAAPFPAPPRALMSDDDRVHVSWAFARDRRQAGAATATLHRIEWSIDKAVPKFLEGGQVAEAARRLAGAAVGAAGPARAQVLELTERVMTRVVRDGLASPDPAVQRLAIAAAAEARLPSAARELRAIADGALDVGQRAAAIDALAEVGDRDSVPMLLAILERDQGANAALTGAAAAALARLDGGAALTRRVTEWLAAGKPGRGQAEKARIWGALIAAGGAPVARAVPEVSRLVRTGEPVVRAAACKALGSATRVEPSAWTGLRKGLGDADASVRAACAGAIAAAAGAGGRSRAAFWAVAPLLRDRDERVRAAAVVAVARLEPRRAAQELAAVGRDTSPVVLVSLAEAWTRTGHLDRVAALFGHDTPAVRTAAVAALAGGDAAARSRVAPLVIDPDPAMRMLAIAISDDRAALTTAVTDDDPGVRAAAQARLIALRGRFDSLADVARAVADAPDGSADRVRLAGAWLAAR